MKNKKLTLKIGDPTSSPYDDFHIFEADIPIKKILVSNIVLAVTFGVREKQEEIKRIAVIW